MNVILFFGSFNPIHNAHIKISEYVLTQNICDEIWLVVSPQNPFKNNDLANKKLRLKWAKKATEDIKKIKVCDIEFTLPTPSYTVKTLIELEKKYPKIRFSILLGLDTFYEIHNWKDHQKIIDKYEIYVYPRKVKNHDSEIVDAINLNAPVLDISATIIRQKIKKGESIKGFVNNKIERDLHNCFLKQSFK